MLKIEQTRAENDGLRAVVLGHTDDDMRKDEILEVFQAFLERSIIICRVRIKYGLAEAGHFQMVKAQKRRRDKAKRNQDKKQLPTAKSPKFAQSLLNMIRLFATHN